MKHYLTEQEFRKFVCEIRPPGTEFRVALENIEGNTTYISFRHELFSHRFILYTSEFCEGVGIIQDDAIGWSGNMDYLWENITEQWECLPFIEVNNGGNNLF